MDLQEEIEVGDDEKLFISSYVKKEKVSGKDSFVVYYDSFPNTYDFEKEAVYLKKYMYLTLLILIKQIIRIYIMRVKIMRIIQNWLIT